MASDPLPWAATDLGELELFRLVTGRAREIVFRFRLAPSPGFDYLSPSVEDVIGRSAADLVADPQKALALVHPEDQPLVRRVLEGHAPPAGPFPLRVIRDDGRLLWLEITVATVAGADGSAEIVGVARDTSDRQIAAAAARDSEERYRTLFDEHTDAAFVIGNDGRILEANDLACSLLGYARDELVALRSRDLFPPEDLVGNPLRIGSLAPHESHSSERRLRRRDGSLVEVMATTRRLGDGRFLGTARDLREQRSAAAALLASSQRFRTLFEQLPLAAFTMDLDGRITSWSPAATRTFGWTADEVIGQPNPIVPADRWQELQENIAHVAGGGLMNGQEFVRRTKDGSEIVVAVWASLVRGRDNTPGEFITICEDVTTRRRAAEEAHQSEERFRSLLNASPATIVVADRKGRIVLANPRVKESFGYEVEELVGQELVLLVPERHRDQHAARAEAFLDDPRDRPLGHGRHLVARHRDGHTFPAEISLTPVRGAGDELDVMATIVDITRREQLEAQLRQVQKFESIGQLSGGIAHDFNNILMAIDGYAELMQGAIDSPDDLRIDLANIRNATQRAIRLTQQLLAFGRRQLLQPEVLDLDHVVEEMAQMLRLLVGERIGVDLRLEPDLAAVRVDRSQIEQVIMNLAVNARDAMPDGGRLLIETANADLDEATASRHFAAMPGPYVLLAVTDTGTGMDDEVQAHLFEPFYTTKEQGKGTGLGLATVFGIVRQSGGTIWVYSEPDRGSSFRIYLPRIDGPTDVAAGIVEAAPTEAGSGTILLVEDDAGVRGFARASLARQGYVVFEAANPDEALALAATLPGRIDLLVTDVIMPGRTGPELATALLASRPDLRVLFISGYTREGALPDVGLGEGQGFLAKPFSISALDREVRRLLLGLTS